MVLMKAHRLDIYAETIFIGLACLYSYTPLSGIQMNQCCPGVSKKMDHNG